jgi:hypothetical protein
LQLAEGEFVYATRRLVLGLLLALPAPVAAEDYPIHLTRTVPVGHRDFVTGSHQAQVLMIMNANGREIKEEKNEIDRYVISTEVLEVGSKGKPTRMDVMVHKLTRESAGTTTALLTGAHVIARIQDGKKVLELRGQPLPKEVADALGHAVNLQVGEAGVSDDDVFGSAERHRIGDTWPANAEAAIKDASSGFSFAPEDFAGTTTLTGLRRLGSTPCIELQLKISIRNAQMTGAERAEGMSVKLTSMTGDSGKIVPADGSLGPIVETSRLDMAMTMSGTVHEVPVTGIGHVLESSYFETFPVRH